MLRWLSRWFVRPKIYHVWVWQDHRWWPAGSLEAPDYRSARQQAVRRNPGHILKVLEVE